MLHHEKRGCLHRDRKSIITHASLLSLFFCFQKGKSSLVCGYAILRTNIPLKYMCTCVHKLLFKNCKDVGMGFVSVYIGNFFFFMM